MLRIPWKVLVSYKEVLNSMGKEVALIKKSTLTLDTNQKNITLTIDNNQKNRTLTFGIKLKPHSFFRKTNCSFPCLRSQASKARMFRFFQNPHTSWWRLTVHLLAVIPFSNKPNPDIFIHSERCCLNNQSPSFRLCFYMPQIPYGGFI